MTSAEEYMDGQTQWQAGVIDPGKVLTFVNFVKNGGRGLELYQHESKFPKASTFSHHHCTSNHC